ncbi:MAG TPA: ABC transporter permease [Candidatus Angelobacter sp.]|nr:ABC transporter permease [Candidatus Angelobacter sp.]
MKWMTSTWLRLKAFVLRRRFDRDLDDELTFHLAMREEKYGSSSQYADEAGYAARRDFGNVARIKEACREMRTFMSFEAFWQDLRFGLRGLRKSPGFAIVAVLTLALGIGTSTWCFNLVRQWVLQAVTYPHSNRLLVAWEIDTKKGWTGSASAPDFLDWREQSREFDGLSAWSFRQFNLTGMDVPERIAGARVSPDFFRTLEVTPFLGRDFRPEEGQPGLGQVALISYGFWHERFNQDTNLQNKTFLLDGERYTVIGVMPENFHFTLMGRANIWVPLVFTEKERANRASGWLNVIGRLKSQINLHTAQQSMSAIAQQMEKQYPESNTNSGVLLRSLSEEIGRNTGELGIYSGFVIGICILLIVCTNIASVYLARALLRRKEMTVRMALGAQKSRLARQLLAESLLLVPAAVALGLGVSVLAANWATASIPYDNRGYLPNYGQIYLDWATFIYATGISLFSVLLFTLAPMLETNKLDLTGSLKATSAESSSSLSGRKLRKALVVAEIVLALVVLVPAGLMSKSLANRFKEDPGFQPDHVLTAKMNLPAAKYREPAQLVTFQDRLLDHLRALPQVQSAGLTVSIPFGHSYGGAEIWIDGRPAPKPGEVPSMAITSVTPGYMPALGLHLVRGRFVSEEDGAAAQPVIVISQTLAHRYFSDEDPLGHKIRLSRDDAVPRTIVGIVKDIKTSGMDDEGKNQSYIPFAQSPNRSITVVMRTAADPLSLVSSLRESVLAVDQDQPISDILALSQRIRDEEAPYRIFAQFTVFFGILALFLAAIGLYGVMAYLVESRSREIGIRMACGAQPRTILWLVLSGNLKLVLAGLSMGLVFAWILAQLLQSLLYHVTANDPATYAAAAVVISTAVLLASVVPLRRAAKVDPMIVLRYE